MTRTITLLFSLLFAGLPAWATNWSFLDESSAIRQLNEKELAAYSSTVDQLLATGEENEVVEWTSESGKIAIELTVVRVFSTDNRPCKRIGFRISADNPAKFLFNFCRFNDEWDFYLQ